MPPSDNMLRKMAADLWLHLRTDRDGYTGTVAGPVAFDRISIPILKHWFKEYDRVTQNAANHKLKREIAEYDAKGYGPRTVAGGSTGLSTAAITTGESNNKLIASGVRSGRGRVVPLNVARWGEDD